MRTDIALLPLLLALAAPLAVANPITGTLTVQDDIILNDSGGSDEFRLKFEDKTSTTPDEIHFWHKKAGDWIWDYDESSTTRMAMSLSADHVLCLYEHSASIAVPKIVLDPGTGTGTAKITIESNEVVTSANALTLIGGTGGKFVQRDTDSSGSVDSLLMEGTYLGSGTIPRTGAGTRMMWYPEKAAFRAGQSGGTNWDDANIGYNSAAFGVSNRAKGAGSFTAGSYNIADGTSAVAFGNLTKATGIYSFAANHKSEATADSAAAFGTSSKANGLSSFAAGHNTLANSNYSTAMGHNTQATNSNAVALGNYSIASGISAVAVGEHPDATGQGSFAAGYHTLASGYYASALGYGSDAIGNNSLAAGVECIISNNGGTAVGWYNENRSTAGNAASSWQGNAEHSVFEVGIGTGTSARKNAFTVLQDGSVEVGKNSTDSTIPLKVNADGTIIITKPQGDISMGVYN